MQERNKRGGSRQGAGQRQARREDDRMGSLADIALEADIIGAVLGDNSKFRACHQLVPDHFSDPVHAELWERILELRQSGKDATAATIAIQIGSRLDAIGGRDLLSDLTVRGLQARSSVAEGAERLRNFALRRNLLALSSDLAEWSFREGMSPEDAISAAISELKLALTSGGSRARSKKEVALEALHLAMKGEEPVPTAILSIDYVLLGGLVRGRSYGIGGMFGTGKTVLLGSISENLNRQSVRHGVITLEMTSENIEHRNIARNIGLNAQNLNDREDRLHPEYGRMAMDHIEKMQVHTWYEHSPGATIDDIERIVLRMIHLHGIQGAFIDYWQLIRSAERVYKREEHLAAVAERLAALAVRENIWIVLFAQCDENRVFRDCPAGLHTAFNHVLVMIRDGDGETAYVETMKTNFTRYASAGNRELPGLVFDQLGPSFRAPIDSDFPGMVSGEAA